MNESGTGGEQKRKKKVEGKVRKKPLKNKRRKKIWELAEGWEEKGRARRRGEHKKKGKEKKIIEGLKDRL